MRSVPQRQVSIICLLSASVIFTHAPSSLCQELDFSEESDEEDFMGPILEFEETFPHSHWCTSWQLLQFESCDLHDDKQTNRETKYCAKTTNLDIEPNSSGGYRIAGISSPSSGKQDVGTKERRKNLPSYMRRVHGGSKYV